MRRRAILAALAVLARPALAADEGAILSPQQMDEKAATVSMFVIPTYPPAAVAAALEATVDLIGEVLPDGRFSLRRIESTSPREEFANAVQEVVPLWLLRPGYGRDCVAKAAAAQVRVWFEMKDGKPRISFSQANRLAPAPKSVGLKLVERLKLEYPDELRRRGIEGALEVILRIAPSGGVENVSVVPGRLSEAASRSLRRLSAWRFEPRAAESGSLCVSYIVDYRFSAM